MPTQHYGEYKPANVLDKLKPEVVLKLLKPSRMRCRVNSTTNSLSSIQGAHWARVV